MNEEENKIAMVDSVQRETVSFPVRVGSMVYEVELYFNQQTGETFRQKLLRLIKTKGEAAA